MPGWGRSRLRVLVTREVQPEVLDFNIWKNSPALLVVLTLTSDTAGHPPPTRWGRTTSQLLPTPRCLRVASTLFSSSGSTPRTEPGPCHLGCLGPACPSSLWGSRETLQMRIPRAPAGALARGPGFREGLPLPPPAISCLPLPLLSEPVSPLCFSGPWPCGA